MTLEEARLCWDAAFTEGWMQAINAKDGEQLHELWMRRLHGTMSIFEVKGEEAVFRMRDEFLQLAKCYLDIKDYDGALRAVEMAKALEKFESDHIITQITWPAKVTKTEFYDHLEGNEHARADR